MKIILVFIVCFCALTASAGVCDTLGFKVNVPKISRTEDRAVGIEITFDSTKTKKPTDTKVDIARLLQGRMGCGIVSSQEKKSKYQVTGKSKKIIIKDENGSGIPGATLSLLSNNYLSDTLNLIANVNGVIITNKLLINPISLISLL